MFKAYWLRAPAGFIFKNCTLCPHCIYVFCIYLRTNSDLCHFHHKLIGFYNGDGKCLLRGTNWVFKKCSLRFVFKSLIYGLDKYIRVSFCDVSFYDDSLLRLFSSRTEHYRLVMHHCLNSSVLSLLSALLALFRCACFSSISVLVQLF